MNRSQLASIELLDGVSNVDGKRRVLAAVKETGVNVDEKKAGIGVGERSGSHVHECVCRQKKKLPIREGIYCLPFSTHHI